MTVMLKLFLSDKPTVILSAIYHIIGIDYIVDYLKNKHVAFFKQDKTVGVSGYVFTCKPWTTLWHEL